MSDLCALLVTDVVDSTAVARRLGDVATAALWREHDRRARDLLRQWSGREIDKSDGFLLLFDAASDAVAYAAAYHRVLGELAVPLKARAGLHVGTVELRMNPQDDVARGAKPVEVDGLAKTIAARAMAVATGGQTLATAAAREKLAGVRCRSHGHWRLKGLDEPVELFEMGGDDAPWTPPAESSKAYRVVWANDRWNPVREIRHSLPAERDAFVGRKAELQQLAARLDAGVRLVTLLGPGGSGKTRLTLQYGRTWLGDYAGGVWFCDLSQAIDADDIAQAVARGLQLDLRGDDPLALTGAAIAGRAECLVILDNFEQVSQYAEGTLGQWLERAPLARFMVTSRERLRIAGEHVLLLDAMPTDDGRCLFRQRAAAACGTGIEAVADDPAIGSLVELLDGMPLAIELAAARTPVMPPAVLLARMGQRFSVLAAGGGRRDRRTTLRATIDWSWELLTPPERSALVQLSVFEAGASLDAVEAVIDLGEYPTDTSVVVDALQSLVEKSLVRQVAHKRFSLLRTVHDYAAEKLADTQRVDERLAPRGVQLRHARFFASLGPRGAVAEQCIDLENLVAAVRCAVTLGEPGLATGALEGAWAAIVLRGPFGLALELAQRVRQMPVLADGQAARCELVVGWAMKALGQRAAGREHFVAALQLTRQAADRHLESKVLGLLGQLDTAQGRVDDARGSLERALAIARDTDDAVLECEHRSNLGSLWLRQGHHDTAAEQYSLALAIARRIGDRRWQGGLLGNLGLVRDEQGHTTEARSHYEAALAIAREVGDRQWEGNTLCNLGLLLQMQGELPEARAALESSLAVAREIGHSGLESTVLCNLALAAEAMLAPDDALQLHGDALRVARELGDKRAEGQVLMYMGLLHARQGRIQPARDSLGASEALLIDVSDQATLGLLQCARAETEHLAGDGERARASLAAAAAVAQQVGVGPDSELGVRLAAVSALIDGPPR